MLTVLKIWGVILIITDVIRESDEEGTLLSFIRLWIWTNFMLYMWYWFASAIFKQALHRYGSAVADVAQELFVGVLGIYATRQMYMHFVCHAASFSCDMCYLKSSAKTACMDVVCGISLHWQGKSLI